MGDDLLALVEERHQSDTSPDLRMGITSDLAERRLTASCPGNDLVAS
jgi:hypothetical protein